MFKYAVFLVLSISTCVVFAMDISGQRRSDNFEDRGITDVVAAQVAPFFTGRLRDVAASSVYWYDIDNSRLSVNIHSRRDPDKIIRLTANMDSFGSRDSLSPVLSGINILPPSSEVGGELLNDSISYQNENDRNELAAFICEEIFGSSYASAVVNVLAGRRNLVGTGQSLDTLQCRHVGNQD